MGTFSFLWTCCFFFAFFVAAFFFAAFFLAAAPFLAAALFATALADAEEPWEGAASALAQLQAIPLLHDTTSKGPLSPIRLSC